MVVQRLNSTKQKSISDKKTSEKMVDKKIQRKCKFYNSGFCRYKDECFFIHPKTICIEEACRDKNCLDRHPKQCRYEDKCRRRLSCLYKHKEMNHSEYVTLKSSNEHLKKEIQMLKLNLEATKTKLSKQEEVKKSEYILLQTSNNDLKKEIKVLKNSLEETKSKLLKVSTEMNIQKVNIKSYNVSDITGDSSTIPASYLRASTKQRKCFNCKGMFPRKTVLADHIMKTFGMIHSYQTRRESKAFPRRRGKALFSQLV